MADVLLTRRHFLAASPLLPLATFHRTEAYAAGKTVKVHFLHHSTGGNLIRGAAGIEAMFAEYNRKHETDYRFTEEWSSPEGDNYPYDYYASTFEPSRLAEYANTYDIIIWKHCFPSSAVLEEAGDPAITSSRKTIGNYMLQYRALRARFDLYPSVRFMVWTLPPLHRMATTAPDALRAATFTDWVRSEYLTEDGRHPNQMIFDFRELAADGDEFLRYEYEQSHDSSDSHPNQTANNAICPLFFSAIIDVINTPVAVSGQRPSGFRVDAPSPNPSNPATTIRYRIPRDCTVRITVCDILGRTVAILQNGRMPAGEHEAVWNGRDANGLPAASGVYLYSFVAAEYRFRGKFALVR